MVTGGLGLGWGGAYPAALRQPQCRASGVGMGWDGGGLITAPGLSSRAAVNLNPPDTPES